jgi:7-cyano-7-deazaguanine synthase
VLLSGGIDSATSLYQAKKDGYEIRALTITFHRIAEGEVAAARALAKSAKVKEHRMVGVPELREAGDVQGLKHPGLPATYIPQRNTIFYGVAASYAEEIGADAIIGGHNWDDQLIFDDATNEYFDRLQEVFWTASRVLRTRETAILRPLMALSKPDVIRLAASLRVPLELTWSCHREGKVPCWSCDGCRSRRRNFLIAGIPDPADPRTPKDVSARRKS